MYQLWKLNLPGASKVASVKSLQKLKSYYDFPYAHSNFKLVGKSSEPTPSRI